MYYTYILQSLNDDTTYIGYTENLRKRFQDHNEGKSTYTKSRLPWKIVYYEAYETGLQARQRELQLKNNSWEKEKLYQRLFDRNQNKPPSSNG